MNPLLFLVMAYTVSIDPSGEVRLDPPPPRAAELYAADSPRARAWEFAGEFSTGTIRVATNRTRFYRAYVKAPPIQLVRILETNRTFRGSTDKDFTNIILVVDGVTNKGWSFSGRNKSGTDGMPVTTRSDFSFREIPVTTATPALLIAWDDDGYVLTTNVWIGPGPFVPLIPPWLGKPGSRPAKPEMLQPPSGRLGLVPANADDPQTMLGWGLATHSSSEQISTKPSFDDFKAGECEAESSSFQNSWDGESSSLSVTRIRCDRGKPITCSATYEGTGPGPMIRTDTGECDFVATRGYIAFAEMGTYDSASDDPDDNSLSIQFKHEGSSSADLWIGGRLRGSNSSNYWCVVAVGVNQALSRIGTELVWEDPPSQPIKKIGGVPTPSGSVVIQVPPQGVWVKVTPGFGKLDHGLVRYWLAASLFDNTDAL